jgi:hypothetical protein
MFTPDYLELEKMWKKGLSITQIGAALGVSRGSISGHIMRARARGFNFEARPTPPMLPPRRLLKSLAPKRVKPPRPPPLLPKPQSPPKPRLLIDSAWNECKYGVAETADGLHLFCGQPKFDRQAYCLAHCLVCYPKFEERKLCR